MIMRIELEHAIEPDQTQEALRWLREINAEGSDRSKIDIIKRMLLGNDSEDDFSGGSASPELGWQLQPPSRVWVRLYT